jgi:transcription antitermination protein NusB
MNGPRRRSREIALQILHQLDVGGASDPAVDVDASIARYFAHLAPAGVPATDDDDGQPLPESERRIDRPLVEQLVGGVAAHRAEIDDLLTQLSRNWRIERMGVVERNVIRIALFELRYAKGTPQAVVVNEAVELAKRYGATEGAAFVNGLLDRAMTELG